MNILPKLSFECYDFANPIGFAGGLGYVGTSVFLLWILFCKMIGCSTIYVLKLNIKSLLTSLYGTSRMRYFAMFMDSYH